ncbi:uncharacterized protein TNIN_216241 [Trichonephila inaurata madagascariensis]|uniref:Uncharacterized protein n=1 Tax=Trichonephila inaurata madagascariensis TaxID=2747483 RepID=A0A8X6WY88_9ARAC|nr:uncharacterized protein TNIN_216241 [Trichonephila inaurata madagascariensis]
MILFMSIVLYAPVLALSAVADLSLEASIIVFGLVCSFYCAIGGLKAVIWADVFQASLILLTLIVLYIKGIGEAGGISEIYRKSAESQRLNIFEFCNNIKRNSPKLVNSLSCEEIQKAEETLIKIMHSERLSEIREKYKDTIQFFEENGILKVQTRLILSQDPEDFTHPTVLPDHPVI